MLHTQTFCIEMSILGMYRIAILKIRPEPDSTGYQMKYGRNWLSEYLLHNKFLGFVCGMNKKALFPVIPRACAFCRLRNDQYCVGCGVKLYYSLACCFQLCVKLHSSPTIKELVYMTHYKSTSHCSLNALTLGSIALPLLALSVVSQTSPVNHL